MTFNIPFNFLSREPNYEKLQYKVKYFDPAGKKVVLKADNAKEIQFQFAGENVRMLSRYNSIGIGNIFSMSTHIFLKLEMDGKLKLQKENGELKRPKGMSFRKDMTEYFSDCPALVEKIEDKDFRKSDLEMMVNFYNSNCSNQKIR